MKGDEETVIPINDVKRVEKKEFSAGKTVFGFFGVLAIVASALMLALVAVVSTIPAD